MKKLIVVALVTVIALLTMVGCVSARAESELKTPLEWAKIEIASDERYDGKEIMWAVMPIEWHELDYNEAMYIIIAMTEDYDLVLDYYSVELEWTVDAERVAVSQVDVDAALFKTEIIGDDGVILDYDNGKIIGDDGEVVIGGNSQTSGE